MYIISLDYHNKRKKKGTENDKYYFTHNNHAALFLSNPIRAQGQRKHFPVLIFSQETPDLESHTHPLVFQLQVSH
jgi:hypothetical protein